MDPGEVAIAAIIFGTSSATILSLAKMNMRAAELRARGADPRVEDRLERIEQAVDAIAVEVERMSESQRFTARLLSERLPDSGALPGAERGKT
jgi:hypothetical protein